MAPSDPLGARFKALEDTVGHTVPAPFCAVRLDGRSFHALTAAMVRPFDPVFAAAMDAAGLAAANAYQNITLAYIQSDEISLIVARGHGYPFRGRVLKLATLAASAASAAFAMTLPAADAVRPPLFDGRVTPLSDMRAVDDYLTWRRLDAMRNAVNACANALYGHARLEGVPLERRAAMLKGTRFDPIDGRLFFGRAWHRASWMKPLPDGRMAERREWRLDAAPQTAVAGWLADV